LYPRSNILLAAYPRVLYCSDSRRVLKDCSDHCRHGTKDVTCE